MYQRNTFERYLTEAEEKQLFNTIKQHGDVYARRDLAMLTLMRQTGIRVGTLTGLDCADARDAVRGKHLVLRPEICKQSGKRRSSGKPALGYTVFANKKAQTALRELLKVRRELGWDEHPDGPLIMSRHGNRISVRSVQDRMQHWCRAARLPAGVSPHWLRHTLAKRIVQRSISKNPVAIVQRTLGQTAVTSAAIYTMPDKEEIEAAVEAAS